MNSDPTGYFTLFEMSAVMNIQSKLQSADASATIGGLMSLMDALLGGERDPMKLTEAFATGVITGYAIGAVFGKLTAVANAGGAYANVALMTKLGLASLGVGLGGISTAQSFSEGKNLQGIFRGISTAIGVHGLKKAFGSAMASFKGSGSGNSVASNSAKTNSGDYANNVVQHEKLKSQYASNEIYNAERVGSALKNDITHRSASYLSKEQLANGRTTTFRGNDDGFYKLLQTKGQLNGRDGIFEFIINAEGQVTHQRFIDGGIYTGFPNQKVPKGGY